MIENDIKRVGQVRLFPPKKQMVRVRSYKFKEHTFYCKRDSGISISKNLKKTETYDRATGTQILTQPFGWEDVVEYFKKNLGFTELDSDKPVEKKKIFDRIKKQTESDDKLYENEIQGKSTASASVTGNGNN